MAKVHPATFLAILAISARCLATRHPVRTIWHLITDERGVVMLVAGIGVMAFAAVLITHTPVTPLVDTFILPVLYLALMRGLDSTIMKSLAVLLAAILCVNACLGIIEMLLQWHLVTIEVPAGATSDPTRADAIFDWRAEAQQDWRAMALLGHPLVNGLVDGAFMICLATPGSRWLPLAVRMPMGLLQLAAMFAFGSRVSLVIALTLVAILALTALSDTLSRAERAPLRLVAITILASGAMIAGVAILYESGFFDRMIERFTNDAGSAQARYTMFEMLRAVSWDDLVLAPNQDVVATWQRLHGLEFGIESSWIGLILTYGLLVTGLVALGLVSFSATIARRSGRGAVFVLLFFFISMSVATGLSGKTTTFAMIELLVLLFVRKEEPAKATRSAKSSGLHQDLAPVSSMLKQ